MFKQEIGRCRLFLFNQSLWFLTFSLPVFLELRPCTVVLNLDSFRSLPDLALVWVRVFHYSTIALDSFRNKQAITMVNMLVESLTLVETSETGQTYFVLYFNQRKFRIPFQEFL